MDRAWRRAGLSLFLTIALASGAPAQDPAVEALLRLHHAQRVAHVLGDAALLAGMFAEPLVEVADGRVARVTRDAARARFGAYFEAVRFLEWEDLRPPRIRLAPAGGWAEVVVEKRVRTVPADSGGRAEAARFAWVERWARGGDGWRLATMASTGVATAVDSGRAVLERGAASEGEARAYAILRRAREALGGEEAVARVATLRLTAACRGPLGRFVTEVASARDGRVSLVQRFPYQQDFAAGVGLHGSWQRSGAGPTVDSLGAVARSVVTGHELHLLALAPEARFTRPVARAGQSLDGRDVDVVELIDGLGAPVRFYYDAATGRPAGFRLANHTGQGAGTVEARFGDWRTVAGVWLPFAIELGHGTDRYIYEVTDASVAWLTDAWFRPDAAGAGRAGAP